MYVCVDVWQRTSVLRSYGIRQVVLQTIQLLVQVQFGHFFFFHGQLTSIEDIYNMSNTEFCIFLIPTKIYICMYIFVKQNYFGRGGTGYKYYAFDFDFYIHLYQNWYWTSLYILCVLYFFGSVDITLTRETESTIQGRVGQGVAKWILYIKKIFIVRTLIYK